MSDAMQTFRDLGGVSSQGAGSGMPADPALQHGPAPVDGSNGHVPGYTAYQAAEGDPDSAFAPADDGSAYTPPAAEYTPQADAPSAVSPVAAAAPQTYAPPSAAAASAPLGGVPVRVAAPAAAAAPAYADAQAAAAYAAPASAPAAAAAPVYAAPAAAAPAYAVPPQAASSVSSASAYAASASAPPAAAAPAAPSADPLAIKIFFNAHDAEDMEAFIRFKNAGGSQSLAVQTEDFYRLCREEHISMPEAGRRIAQSAEAFRYCSEQKIELSDLVAAHKAQQAQSEKQRTLIYEKLIPDPDASRGGGLKKFTPLRAVRCDMFGNILAR